MAITPLVAPQHQDRPTEISSLILVIHLVTNHHLQDPDNPSLDPAMADHLHHQDLDNQSLDLAMEDTALDTVAVAVDLDTVAVAVDMVANPIPLMFHDPPNPLSNPM
ncbi:MAG: hypothetical protein LC650_03020 [Actinobacteria bacterium]|nr:hypothetical protein [Actinomycetota bacterium]